MNSSQMYKVFFNEQAIYIVTNDYNKSLTDAVKINTAQELMPLLVAFLENEEELIITNDNPQEVFEWLKAEMLYLEAAGGIVKNEDDELLFIYRLDYWDLPKGKIEAGETPEVAAYREIKEECGISSHQLEEHLIDTYHMYERSGKMHLKKTFWYLFDLKDQSEEVLPQEEEDIELVSWFGDAEIELAMLETYESIKEVYSAYQEL